MRVYCTIKQSQSRKDKNKECDNNDLLKNDNGIAVVSSTKLSGNNSERHDVGGLGLVAGEAAICAAVLPDQF